MLMSKAASDTLENVSGQFESELLVELGEGKKQALALMDASKRDAKAAVSKILDTGDKQAESLKRQLVGAAELEVRNAQLKALETAVVEVFEKATRGVQELQGARYEKSLVSLLREGVEVLGPRATVSCRAKDRRAVSAAIGRLGQNKLILAKDPVETIGGVVMTSMDGSVRFDNTFEARLERMRPTLRMEVSSTLSST